MNGYRLKPDGSVPAEDDSLLHYPTDDDVLDDADTAWDPEVDQRVEPETPAHDDEKNR